MDFVRRTVTSPFFTGSPTKRNHDDPSPLKDEPYDDRDSWLWRRGIHDLVDEAALVGWTRSEAMAAIVNLALNQMFAETENERTNFRLAIVHRALVP